MGRYLSSTSLHSSPLAGRTLRLYCKLRYLISILRTVPRLATAHLSQDLCSSPLPSSPLMPDCVISAVTKNSRLRHRTVSTPEHHLRNINRGTKLPSGVRFYSSSSSSSSPSSRDRFKAEAPIGVLQDSQTAFQLRLLGVRLGESFNRLSRHINVYFKRKDVPIAAIAGNVDIVVAAPGYFGKVQRRAQSNKGTKEKRTVEEKESAQTLKCEENQETFERATETPPAGKVYAGVQLFHISSLATRFGESYNYVANHINTAFSRDPAQEVKIDDIVEDLSISRGSTRRQRRRRIQSPIENAFQAEQVQFNTCATEAQHLATESSEGINTMQDRYFQFAQHVNRYFGAQGTKDKEESHLQKERRIAEQMLNNGTYQKQFRSQSTSTTENTSELKQAEPLLYPKSPGLFHVSNMANSFGESYMQTANHVNCYFKGRATEDKKNVDCGSLEKPGEWTAAGFTSPHNTKAISFMDCIRNPTTAIPNFLGGYVNFGPFSQGQQGPHASKSQPDVLFKKRVIMGRRQAEEVTRMLICGLEQALSPQALTSCVEELNKHLIRYPACKAVVWQEKTAVQLLRKRRNHKHNQELQSVIREALAIIGYVDAVKGHGIRVLSIDGGGTRGLVPLQMLKLLEAETGKPIHQLFDYICGVSTGAVLAFMIGLARFSLEECEEMYRRFGTDVFRQNPLVGTVKMGWSHSYYCTDTWEGILREKMGDKVLIKTAGDQLSPKVSAVSAVVNWGNSPKAFIFRNYNHTPGCLSRYAGGSSYEMWQAVRASSAAPGYFQEFSLHSDIHQDGGILLNNPCALAVHESRLLWPNQPFQCVLSLGTGRYDNAKRIPGTSTSLRAKISSLICSATDTEGVHTLLDDLLPPNVYFRFNPMLSAEVSLDESRAAALNQLQADTKVYLERNKPKLARLCLVLGAERTAVSRTKDWVRERAWEMKHNWI